MKKTPLIRIVSLLLLQVLLLFLTPKEFIHAFHDHEDTQHQEDTSPNGSLEQQHIHCTWLNFETTVFDTPSSVVIPSVTVTVTSDIQEKVQSIILTSEPIQFLRGPPSQLS